VWGRDRYVGLVIYLYERGDMCTAGDYAITKATRSAKRMHRVLTQEFRLEDGNALMRRAGLRP
jgi:hypothetical protein